MPATHRCLPRRSNARQRRATASSNSISRRLFEVAALLYQGPWVAERHSVVKQLLAEQPEAFDPAVRQVIGRAVGISATDTFEAQYRLRELQGELQALWQQVDVLMVPTAPGHPRFEEVDADPLGVNSQLGTYTNFVNLLGWCALALPAGMTAAGLPFGVTFIAPGAHDVALLDFARRWQGQVGAALRPHGPDATAFNARPLAPTSAPAGQRAAAGFPLQPASQPSLPIAVVGAHLSGLPLNGQLLQRGAWLRETHAHGCRVSAVRIARHAAAQAGPAACGCRRRRLRHRARGLGHARASARLVSCARSLRRCAWARWSWPTAALFTASSAKRTPCGAARDISHFGGWRAYLASL